MSFQADSMLILKDISAVPPSHPANYGEEENDFSCERTVSVEKAVVCPQKPRRDRVSIVANCSRLFRNLGLYRQTLRTTAYVHKFRNDIPGATAATKLTDAFDSDSVHNSHIHHTSSCAVEKEGRTKYYFGFHRNVCFSEANQNLECILVVLKSVSPIRTRFPCLWSTKPLTRVRGNPITLQIVDIDEWRPILLRK